MYQIYSKRREGPLSQVAKVAYDGDRLLRYASQDAALNKKEEMDIRYPDFVFFVAQVDTAHIYDPNSFHEQAARIEERLSALEQGVVSLREALDAALSVYAGRMDAIRKAKLEAAADENRVLGGLADALSYKQQPKDPSFRKGRNRR